MSEKANKLIKLKEKKELLQKELKGLQQKLSLESRKSRISRLIHLGELFEKAGFSISDLENKKLLLGALLQVKEELVNPAACAKWESLGQRNFDQQPLKRLAVVFKQDPEESLKDKLKQLGLRWNKIRQEWQGKANQIEVQEALKNSGAQIECLQE